MTNRTVLIFGVFDAIHDGHLSFIGQAKKEGDHLVVIVARDEVVKELKGKFPEKNEVERINKLLEISDVDLVLLGDPERETYNTLKEVKPDILFLGYDQNVLGESIEKNIKSGKLPKMKVIKGKPFKPEIFHSSILNNK